MGIMIDGMKVGGLEIEKDKCNQYTSEPKSASAIEDGVLQL
jgi:hypothetical protein